MASLPITDVISLVFGPFEPDDPAIGRLFWDEELGILELEYTEPDGTPELEGREVLSVTLPGTAPAQDQVHLSLSGRQGLLEELSKLEIIEPVGAEIVGPFETEYPLIQINTDQLHAAGMVA